MNGFLVKTVLAAALLGGLWSSPALAGEAEVREVSRLRPRIADRFEGSAVQLREELFELTEADPETRELLREVAAGLGFSSPAEVLELVRLCDVRRGSSAEDTDRDGETLTSLSAGHMHVAFSSADRLSGSSDGTEAFGKRMFRTGVALAKPLGTKRLHVMETPVICLKNGGFLSDQFQTFIHELAHLRGAIEEFVKSEDPGVVDVLDFEDADDFAEKELMRPGGEFDAHVAGIRSSIRMGRANGYSFHWRHEAYMDEEGNLTDPEALKRKILDAKGYRGTFRRRYFEVWVPHNVERTGREITYHAKLRDYLEDRIRSTRNLLERSRLAARLSRVRSNLTGLLHRRRELRERFPWAFEAAYGPHR